MCSIHLKQIEDDDDDEEIGQDNHNKHFSYMRQSPSNMSSISSPRGQTPPVKCISPSVEVIEYGGINRSKFTHGKHVQEIQPVPYRCV